MDGFTNRVIDVLNEALVAELVCVRRYKQHHVTADRIAAKEVAQEFLEHAGEEQQHADWIARRIVQLGGSPTRGAAGLAASCSEHAGQASLPDMLREDLRAEDIAIESYADIKRWLGNDDFTTRTLIESILTMEAQHADDLRSLLATLEPAAAHRSTGLPSAMICRRRSLDGSEA